MRNAPLGSCLRNPCFVVHASLFHVPSVGKMVADPCHSKLGLVFALNQSA
jgi:hypothetical protein